VQRIVRGPGVELNPFYFFPFFPPGLFPLGLFLPFGDGADFCWSAIMAASWLAMSSRRCFSASRNFWRNASRGSLYLSRSESSLALVCWFSGGWLRAEGSGQSGQACVSDDTFSLPPHASFSTGLISPASVRRVLADVS
jgi:hypothetical protein